MWQSPCRLATAALAPTNRTKSYFATQDWARYRAIRRPLIRCIETVRKENAATQSRGTHPVRTHFVLHSECCRIPFHKTRAIDLAKVAEACFLKIVGTLRIESSVVF